MPKIISQYVSRGRKFASAVSRFARSRSAAYRSDERGTTMIYFTVVFSTMIAFSGMAIDIARYEAKRSKLAANLDNCTLASASLRNSITTLPENVVDECMTLAGLIPSHVVTTDLEKTVNTITYRHVETEASATVETLFMDMLGIETLPIKIRSVAEERIPRVELSLILDISGSMYGDKLSTLVTAAQGFVDDVLAANTASDPYRISISLVPYNMQVNGGKTLYEAFGGTSNHDYSHCAEWTANAYTTLDFSPNSQVQAPPLIYVPSGYDWRERFSTSTFWANVDSDEHDYTRKGYRGSSRDYLYKYMDDVEMEGYYCRQHEWAQVLPFSADAAELKARIGAFEALGNTSIDIAMKWGGALLNPNHQSVVTQLTTLWPSAEASQDDIDAADPQAVDPGFDGRPVQYGTNDTMKIVVLMTDGYNTIEYRAKSAYRDGDSPRYKKVSGNLTSAVDIYETHAGDPEWEKMSWDEYWQHVPVNTHVRRVGSYNSWTNYLDYDLGTAEKNTRLSNICKEVRDPDGDDEDEIIVFTIAYSAPDEGKAAMQDCASEPVDFHYFAADQTTIQETFSQIGGVIEKLKLVQ
ncbi:MAG: hypothetical protein AAF429_09285 [Pseudomonadota bacterium]